MQSATAEKYWAERRAAPRVWGAADDYVAINNVHYPLRNWSPLGLLFGPMAVPPQVGQNIIVKVSVVIGDERLRFEALSEVLRVTRGEAACRYTCLTHEAVPQINAYFAKIK